MPRYLFACTDCGREADLYRTFDEFKRTEPCADVVDLEQPFCTGTLEKQLTRPFFSGMTTAPNT